MAFTGSRRLPYKMLSDLVHVLQRRRRRDVFDIRRRKGQCRARMYRGSLDAGSEMCQSPRGSDRTVLADAPTSLGHRGQGRGSALDGVLDLCRCASVLDTGTYARAGHLRRPRRSGVLVSLARPRRRISTRVFAQDGCLTASLRNCRADQMPRSSPMPLTALRLFGSL